MANAQLTSDSKIRRNRCAFGRLSGLGRFMLRSLMLTGAALVSAASMAMAYDIKPKTPDTVFSGKLRPDIIGISSSDDAAKT